MQVDQADQMAPQVRSSARMFLFMKGGGVVWEKEDRRVEGERFSVEG